MPVFMPVSCRLQYAVTELDCCGSAHIVQDASAVAYTSSMVRSTRVHPANPDDDFHVWTTRKRMSEHTPAGTHRAQIDYRSVRRFRLY
jgi:hypothetical protein